MEAIHPKFIADLWISDAEVINLQKLSLCNSLLCTAGHPNSKKKKMRNWSRRVPPNVGWSGGEVKPMWQWYWEGLSPCHSNRVSLANLPRHGGRQCQLLLHYSPGNGVDACGVYKVPLIRGEEHTLPHQTQTSTGRVWCRFQDVNSYSNKWNDQQRTAVSYCMWEMESKHTVWGVGCSIRLR